MTPWQWLGILAGIIAILAGVIFWWFRSRVSTNPWQNMQLGSLDAPFNVDGDHPEGHGAYPADLSTPQPRAQDEPDPASVSRAPFDSLRRTPIRRRLIRGLVACGTWLCALGLGSARVVLVSVIRVGQRSVPPKLGYRRPHARKDQLQGTNVPRQTAATKQKILSDVYHDNRATEGKKYTGVDGQNRQDGHLVKQSRGFLDRIKKSF